MDSCAYTKSMHRPVSLFPTFLQHHENNRIVRIAHLLLRGKASAADNFMPHISLVVKDQCGWPSIERDSIQHLRHRRFGILDRFGKLANENPALARHIHIDHTHNLHGLNMSLQPSAIPVSPFLGIFSIARLRHACHHCQDIVRPPQIPFRRHIWLTGLHHFLVPVKFEKLGHLASDDARLLHFPHRPSVKSAIFIDGIQNIFRCWRNAPARICLLRRQIIRCRHSLQCQNG